MNWFNKYGRPKKWWPILTVFIITMIRTPEIYECKITRLPLVEKDLIVAIPQAQISQKTHLTQQDFKRKKTYTEDDRPERFMTHDLSNQRCHNSKGSSPLSNVHPTQARSGVIFQEIFCISIIVYSLRRQLYIRPRGSWSCYFSKESFSSENEVTVKVVLCIRRLNLPSFKVSVMNDCFVVSQVHIVGKIEQPRQKKEQFPKTSLLNSTSAYTQNFTTSCCWVE